MEADGSIRKVLSATILSMEKNIRALECKVEALSSPNTNVKELSYKVGSSGENATSVGEKNST